jgi:HTH-type transcriptional regulator / antitoxin HipB
MVGLTRGDHVWKFGHGLAICELSEKADIPSGLLLCRDMQTSNKPDDSPGVPRTGRPFRLYTAASVGAAIRQYREEAGLTQEELASMAGLNRTYLSELEQGRETEQMRRILRLLKLLGVRATLQKADW